MIGAWVDEAAMMSAPTPDEEDQALASLTGASVPVDVDRAVTRLRLIGDAREAGVPWAQIGASLGGMSGKAAKAAAKRLARDTRRQLAAVRAQAPAEDHGGPYEHVLGDTTGTLNYIAPG